MNRCFPRSVVQKLNPYYVHLRFLNTASRNPTKLETENIAERTSEKNDEKLIAKNIAFLDWCF